MLRICSIFLSLVAVSLSVTTGAHAQSSALPYAPTVLSTRTCVPLNIGDFQSHIHVKCSDIVNGVQYFAVGTADSNRAARVLAVLSGAYLGGRTLTIGFDDADQSGVAIGCTYDVCRLITWVVY